MHALTLQTAKEKEPTACRRVVFLAGGNAEALDSFPFEGNIKGDRIRCMCRIRNACKWGLVLPPTYGIRNFSFETLVNASFFAFRVKRNFLRNKINLRNKTLPH